MRTDLAGLIYTLERRRLRGDLIEKNIWMTEFNKGDVSKVLVVKVPGRTRSNGLKLGRVRFNEDMGRNWLTNRVVDEWNKLGSHVVVPIP